MGDILYRLFAIFEGYILSPLIWLSPLKWARVLPGSACVRFTWGKCGAEIHGGCVVFATTFQTLAVQHVARIPQSTEAVKALTSDGVPVSVNTVIVYTITDLGAFLTRSESTPTYLTTVVDAFVLGAVQGSTFAELNRGWERLQDKMRDTLNVEMVSVGVHVLHARFQNIEHLDPVTRAMLSSRIGAAALRGAANELRKGHMRQMSFSQAVFALSSAVQYTWAVDQDVYQGIETIADEDGE
jgi:regulator of protease activity HflC (stomatin/prohibitin superfamily)